MFFAGQLPHLVRDPRRNIFGYPIFDFATVLLIRGPNIEYSKKFFTQTLSISMSPITPLPSFLDTLDVGRISGDLLLGPEDRHRWGPESVRTYVLF